MSDQNDREGDFDDDEEADSDLLQPEDDDEIPCEGCGETLACASWCPEVAKAQAELEEQRYSEAGRILTKLVEALES